MTNKDEVIADIDPKLAKEILETKAQEESQDRGRREGTKTVRIPQEVYDLIAKHGKFGETVGDVLLRIFDDYAVGIKENEK